MSSRRKPDDCPVDRRAASGTTAASRAVNAWLARWLLIAVALAGTLAAMWLAAGSVTASAAEVVVVPAEGTTLGELVDADLPAGTALRFEQPLGPLMLHVEDVALGSRLLADAARLLWLGLWASSAAVLAGIVGEIAAGRPFTVKVSRNLTVLIGIAAIGSFVPSVVDNVASLVLMTGVGIAPPESVFGLQILELNVAALLAVLVLASLERAIRHGRSLTDDVEGLV